MTLPEHTLTEFLQHSGTLLPEVERGGLLLRRRDGEDLVVMTRGQSEALHDAVRALAGAVLEGLESASRQAKGAGVASPAAGQRVLALFPWMAYLSERDRIACLREIGEVASAAVGAGRADRLEEVLAEWRATGLAAWDEKRLRERDDRDAYRVDDPVALPRPSASR